MIMDWFRLDSQLDSQVGIAAGSIATSALEFVIHDESTRSDMERSSPLRRIGVPGGIAATAVVAAPTGLLTALDVPLVTGRGLVR